MNRQLSPSDLQDICAAMAGLAGPHAQTEARSERYLGLVLFGQPQFAARLVWPRFREIAERLAVFELPPFSAEDTENFLDHCLRAAHLPTPATPIADFGSRIADSQNPRSEIRDPQLLSPDAFRAISSRASTPLAVANLAAAGMIEAYKKGERQVTARFIPADGGPRYRLPPLPRLP